MWTLLLAPLAFAGTVVIDARVPVEVWIAGGLIGEIASPAELHVTVPAGDLELTLVVGGKPQIETVQVPESGKALLIVGRTGVTTGHIDAVATSEAASSMVEFRSSAREDMILVVGKDRVTLSPGATRRIDLARGTTALSLRDSSGTVVWAHGTLDVKGDGLVVQVADGRLPEISGAGAFHPDP